MIAMPDLAETRELAGLLIALVGQTAVHISQCAEQCGLSVVQASALLRIDGSISMRELATRLGGHASNATGIADRLAARGLVERREDPDDRRVKRVDLTPEGAATRHRLTACMESARTPFARARVRAACRLDPGCGVGRSLSRDTWPRCRQASIHRVALE